MNKSILRSLLFAPFLLFISCGDNNDEEVSNITPQAEDIELAANLLPANAALAAKYDRSCRNCHARPDAAAPLTGHSAAWAPRFDAKGQQGLLTSTKLGLKAMPAMGLCNDCSDPELTALISFMAGGKD
ncbi:c-type cytochrome [Alphaproteobacteria bacterium]|jgi:cytochrome c5|nr:c-type cytochrome [Alphaproteobacteria bacterium]